MGKAWPPHPLGLGTPPLTWGLVGRRGLEPRTYGFASGLADQTWAFAVLASLTCVDTFAGPSTNPWEVLDASDRSGPPKRLLFGRANGSLGAPGDVPLWPYIGGEHHATDPDGMN